MTAIRAYAVQGPEGPFEPFKYEAGALGPDEVEIDVAACGICHSDLSMVRNEWGFSEYPLVPGHEVVGKVAQAGSAVPNLAVGRTVGLGWFSRSCLHCAPCMSGDHNLCETREQTIVGRYGGFADKVRCHWSWAIPLPDGLDLQSAGPLFCGGVTVFNPLIQSGVRPTDRVGVVGIGGLGHLALQFCNKWGCEVTAFTSSPAKAEEARGFGAHHVVDSLSEAALEAIAGTLDFLLVTVAVPLDWQLYLGALKPRGTLHIVGAVPEPLSVMAFELFPLQKRITGTPLGSPATTAQMLDFCARHAIAPRIEAFPMSRVNDAMARLEAGEARYRIVLENDFPA
jgi:uncharacterized zinc-type alcohol dehydrogenase-like protein